jgi:hypothetical protein
MAQCGHAVTDDYRLIVVLLIKEHAYGKLGMKPCKPLWWNQINTRFKEVYAAISNSLKIIVRRYQKKYFKRTWHNFHHFFCLPSTFLVVFLSLPLYMAEQRPNVNLEFYIEHSLIWLLYTLKIYLFLIQNFVLFRG